MTLKLGVDVTVTRPDSPDTDGVVLSTRCDGTRAHHQRRAVIQTDDGDEIDTAFENVRPKSLGALA